MPIYLRFLSSLIKIKQTQHPRFKHRALFKARILFVYFRLLLRRRKKQTKQNKKTKKSPKNSCRAEAEALFRKAVYLPLLDHYPGLGLLYCIWHLERSLPAAFRCVSLRKKKHKTVFRGRLIMLFIPPPYTVEGDSSLATEVGRLGEKGYFFRFLFVGAAETHIGVPVHVPG